ncbi:MAG: C69 family dipeptidase [Chloroflexi bacterium]|nr:C69 family dipeptidase [Chloroflexota bacterium]MBI3339813.1 C69 family dipeptidase [Chloroflexota bacterium]
MCDTLIATPETTKDGVMIFGKNSDREPNEAHHVVSYPAMDHAQDSRVKCTYIDIPQARHTYAILLAKPFWIWGAEMGANEHGLVIGNEALFTRIPYNKNGGLLGMDLLRLALERAATAHEGVKIITDLLAQFSQGGNHGLAHETYYHNSYILADPHDAWVLETAGRHWAAKKIKGIYSISNGITIENDFDLASPELVSFAVQRGWCKNESDFSFARCYSDLIFTRFSDCRKRRARSMYLLDAQRGQITVETMMSALRDHGQADGSQRSADESLAGADICMHAGFGPIRISQTTGSMVSYLDAKSPLHFATATAAPCTSIFKPIWIDASLPDLGPAPVETYDSSTLFWRHERLHRSTLRDHENLIATFAPERNALEREFVAEAFSARTKNAAARAKVSAECFARADEAEAKWLARVQSAPSDQSWHHASAWKQYNRDAKIPAKVLQS